MPSTPSATNSRATAPSGAAGDLVRLEAHYRASPFIAEICLIRDPTDRESTLFAVVVPDLERIDHRRVANVGDLFRFELEGLTVDLAPADRVTRVEVWFTPLPRTRDGRIDRAAVEQRVRDGRLARTARQSASELATSVSRPVEVVRPLIDRLQAHLDAAAPLTSSCSLELDFGLDSMSRVALFAELERLYGVRPSPSQAHRIHTVGDLLHAFLPDSPGLFAVDPDGPDPWDTLLAAERDDRELSAQLGPRRLTAPIVWFASRLLRRLIVRVRVAGASQLAGRDPLIIAANHQSFLDPFLVCSVVPYRRLTELFVLGAGEYLDHPVSMRLARQVRCLSIDPDALLVPALRAAAFGLSRGRTLLVFPEGERSIDGRVKRFKRGALLLARRADVPLIPTAIRGADDVWPRGRPITRRALGPWSRATVRIRFGRPFRVPPGMTDAEAARELQARVEALWREA